MQIRLDFRSKDHMITRNSPRLHLHPTTQPCKYDFSLEQRTIWLKQTLRDFTCIRLLNHANTTSPWNKGPYDYKKLSWTSPASDYSTMQIRLHLRTKDHMIMKQLPKTYPASDDFTVRIRLHLRTTDHMITKKTSWDLTCIRWLYNANTISP